MTILEDTSLRNISPDKDKYFGAGLHVLTTICDQGTTNELTATELMEETWRIFLRNGRMERISL
jgi:hypothetical protein